MLRPAALFASIAFAAGVSACGHDEPSAARSGDRSSSAPAHVRLSEARTLLERDQVELTRQATDGDAGIATEVSPEPTDSARLTTSRGPKFDLLAFATPSEARRAWESVLHTDVIDEGGTAVRAVNLVAVFPPRSDEAVYEAVNPRLRRLADACAEPSGEVALRRLCFDDPEQVQPAGEGTDTDEMARIGATLSVAGVAFDVTTARQLNPYRRPDEQILGGRRPSDDALFFAVFVRACNEEGPAATPTSRFTIVNAFGRKTEPIDLPAGNALAYDPRRLKAGECIPAPSSAADRTTDGAALVFELPSDRLDERPLGLQIVSENGSERATVTLDV